VRDFERVHSRDKHNQQSKKKAGEAAMKVFFFFFYDSLCKRKIFYCFELFSLPTVFSSDIWVKKIALLPLKILQGPSELINLRVAILFYFILFCNHYFSPLNIFMRKGKDPDPYL
jgi:hypothetical protein